MFLLQLVYMLGRIKHILKYFFYAIMALFFIGVIFILSPKVKAADSDHLVINEIYPVPDTKCNDVVSPNCKKEWVEIFNPTDSDVNLSSFALYDEAGNTKPLSGNIVAGDYYIYYNSSGWLNNSDEVVYLKSIRSLEISDIIDQAEYASCSSQKSLQRIPNGIDTDNDQTDFRILVPTPGEENILPTYSDQIIINEIVPHPATSSSDEFIELYNFGISDVDLSGWQIDDIAGGGSSPYTIPTGTIILVGKYLTFYNSIDHISLNDSGDSARLIDPNGDEKSATSYLSSDRGQSYSKFDSGWQWTTKPTPLAKNLLIVEVAAQDPDVQIIETDISSARNLPDEETVQVTGIISVTPGKLSSQYFYIQDDNSGIQIYNYNKDFPNLTQGDQIQVIGELGTTNNEKRIKISLASDIIILSTHPPPEAKKTTISEIGENLEGKYISVIGTVTKTSGNTFFIHGSGEIQVSIREGTDIEKPRMKVGDKVQIAGILSQYKDNYRILPITQNDVKIISSAKLAKSGPTPILALITSFIITWIISVLQQRKRKSLRRNFST